MVCMGKLNWVWIPPPSSKRRLQAAWKHKKKGIFVFLVIFCLEVTIGTEAQVEGAAVSRMGMVVTGSGGSSLAPWAAQPTVPKSCSTPRAERAPDQGSGSGVPFALPPALPVPGHSCHSLHWNYSFPQPLLLWFLQEESPLTEEKWDHFAGTDCRMNLGGHKVCPWATRNPRGCLKNQGQQPFSPNFE